MKILIAALVLFGILGANGYAQAGAGQEAGGPPTGMTGGEDRAPAKQKKKTSKKKKHAKKKKSTT